MQDAHHRDVTSLSTGAESRRRVRDDPATRILSGGAARRLLAIVAFLLPAGVPAFGQDAAPDEGPVYIADEATDLEEILEEVLVRNRPRRLRRFWLLVTGDQILRVTKLHALADPQLARAVDLVRQMGAHPYACESDMARLGVLPGDLLPYFEPFKGFEAAAPPGPDGRLYEGERSEELPASDVLLRRMRSACSS
jgi:hypothetical protein